MKISSSLTVIFIWFSLFSFSPVNAGSANLDSPQRPEAKRIKNNSEGSFEFLREPLQEAGLKLKDGSPDEMDLDGDGEAEYLGHAESDVKFGDYYVPAFYIAGKVSGEYRVLYKLVLGDAHFFDEMFVDFDRDGVKDFYFRYGDSDYDYGYTLLWIKKGRIREIYQKNDPDYFYLEDLDEDGFYEIIQMKGPYAGPNSDGMIREWTWKDVYRWDPKEKKFVTANERYPDFYRKLRKQYNQILLQIKGKDVPGHLWSAYEKSFLELGDQIENDFLLRIKEILGEGGE